MAWLHSHVKVAWKVEREWNQEIQELLCNNFHRAHWTTKLRKTEIICNDLKCHLEWRATTICFMQKFVSKRELVTQLVNHKNDWMNMSLATLWKIVTWFITNRTNQLIGLCGANERLFRTFHEMHSSIWRVLSKHHWFVNGTPFRFPWTRQICSCLGIYENSIDFVRTFFSPQKLYLHFRQRKKISLHFSPMTMQNHFPCWTMLH